MKEMNLPRLSRSLVRPVQESAGHGVSSPEEIERHRSLSWNTPPYFGAIRARGTDVRDKYDLCANVMAKQPLGTQVRASGNRCPYFAGDRQFLSPAHDFRVSKSTVLCGGWARRAARHCAAQQKTVSAWFVQTFVLNKLFKYSFIRL